MRRLLLRKAHYRSNTTPPVREAAFWPRPNDDKGLSLSRRRSELFGHFLTEWQFKAQCTYPEFNLADRCGVCAFLAETALSIGLKVLRAPTPTDPGHLLLPQINYPNFEGSEQSREEIRVWINQLIEAASRHILIEPGTPNSASPVNTLESEDNN